MHESKSAERQATTPVEEQLDALQSMSMTALRDRFRELFHEEARTHNVQYLRKKLAWRIQELAEGGLSELARGRIAELSKTSPIRHRGHPQPRAPKDVTPPPSSSPTAEMRPESGAPRLEAPVPSLHEEPMEVPEACTAALPPLAAPPAQARTAARPTTKERGDGEVIAPASKSERDPRLPPVGSRIRRAWGTSEHLVLMLDDGFLYEGQRYASLSRVARAITGTNWNGFAFFGLTSPWQGTTP